MPIPFNFAGRIRIDQPSCEWGGVSCADTATAPWWWRLVARLIPSRSCGDQVPSKTFPWHDLPTDLVEVILAKVPLLRLAQLASMRKEFWAAYQNCLAAQAALPDWLGHDTAEFVLNPYYAAVREEFDFRRAEWHLRKHIKQGPLRLSGPCRGICVSPRWTVDTLQLSHDVIVHLSCCFPGRVQVILRCVFKDLESEDSFTVGATLECQLEKGATLMRIPESLLCESLTLFCQSERPYFAVASVMPSLPIFLMLCTAIAPSLRKLMHEVALKLCRGRRPLRAVPIQSVRLVLPGGVPMPDEAEEAAMWNGITSVLAIVGGKPSGARVVTQEAVFRNVVSRWRLPCVIKGR